LQVEKERTPTGRLMLAYRGNNRNVVLGVGGIQERVEASSPWRDFFKTEHLNQFYVVDFWVEFDDKKKLTAGDGQIDADQA
jgi:hypothetical protein